MNLQGKRVKLKRDICVTGISVGAPATVMFYFPNEFFPVQLEFDQKDADGHSIYRVELADIREFKETKLDWIKSGVSLFV